MRASPIASPCVVAVLSLLAACGGGSTSGSAPAVDADGLSGWTQDAAPIRRLTDFAWTAREIRSPHALLDGTTLRLYFAGDDLFNTGAWGIGQMTCSLAP